MADHNHIFEAKVHLPHSPETVFSWHEMDGAFERLAPPWLDVGCLERSGGIGEGSRVVLLLHRGPLALRWRLGHKDYVQNRQFVDYQIKGPFAFWEQHHQVEAQSGGTLLTDRACYRMPFFPFGEIAAPVVHADLERLFRYRHSLMRRDLALKARYGKRPLKVLVTGGTGLVGSQLIPLLLTQGHKVVQLVRPGTPQNFSALSSLTQICWDPLGESIATPLPEDLDAAVHLAGRNVAAGRWTEAVKREIEESRVQSTAYLVKLLAGLKNPPQVFVCASAMDFYGDTGVRAVSEDDPAGESFLANVCKRWEGAATAGNNIAGMRVVNLRVSGVLTPKGGPLGKLLPVFKAGLGGPVGDGRQYFSWISIDDMIGCIYHAIATAELEGPLNAVAPNVPTYGEFAATLGRILGRPAIMPLPAPFVKVLLGEMGDALLLASRRLVPQKLAQSGYEFLDPELAEALKYMLGLSAGYQH